MGGRDDAGTPDPAEKGFATLATLRYGELIPILLSIYMKSVFYTVAYTYYVYRIGVKAMVEKVILFTCITNIQTYHVISSKIYTCADIRDAG